MHSLGVYSCGFFFGINIISHHIIISHRIPSYIIFASARNHGEEGKFLLQKYISDHEKNVLYHKICLRQIYFYTGKGSSSAVLLHNNCGLIYSIGPTEGESFSSRRMKRREGVFFASGSKTVCTKVSCITKKYIILIHMQIVDTRFLQRDKGHIQTLNS
jgi:hypothetical protein